MNILLVNDDGIDSKRLMFTKRCLEKIAKVTVVAPLKEQSGRSCAISIDGIKYKKVTNDIYTVDGTPADCVTFGIYGLNNSYDFVVSGVNNGYNLGVDTMYSGTVGAALQALYHNHKAVALSGHKQSNETIDSLLEITLNYIIDQKMLSKEYIINVNFPIKIDKDSLFQPSMTKPYFIRRGATASFDDYVCRVKRNKISVDLPSDSDLFAIRNGKVSISKIYLSGEVI